MTCAEFKRNVAALALGALENAEVSACQSHLERGEPHEGCREALDRARTTAAQLGLALPPVRPSDQVWQAIERRIGLLGLAEVPRPQLIRQIASWGLAAVLAALLLHTHSVQLDLEDQQRRNWRALNKLRVYAEQADEALEEARVRAQANAQAVAPMKSLESEHQQCLDQLEGVRTQVALQRDALALLQKHDTQVVALQPQGGRGGRASVIHSAEAGRAIVIASELQAGSGKALQIWLIRRNDTAVPAGFLRPVVDDVAIGEIDRKLLVATSPEALAISLEPAGGGAKPTEMMMLGEVRVLTANLPPLP